MPRPEADADEDAEEADADEDAEEADIAYDNDIYDMTVVAAFGGVHMHLGRDDKILCHPLVLLFFGTLLFLVQFESVMFLRMDMQLAEPVVDESDPKILIQLKILMIVILQLMLFKELMGAVKLVVFLCNPTTWTDVVRPDNLSFSSGAAKFMFRPAVLFCSSMWAPIFKLAIAYIVCVDSVSLILEARRAKDAIFNCLAITFIAELDTVTWEMVSTLFYFELKNDFRIQLWSKEQKHKNLNQEGDCGSKAIKRLADTFPGIRRGQGGRRVEFVFTLCVMVVMYGRQLIVVLMALDSNILPVARDVCAMWRWMHGHAIFPWIAYFGMKIVRFLMVRNLEIQINDLKENELQDQCLADDKYGRMSESDYMGLLNANCVIFLVVMGTVVGLLLLPQVLVSNCRHSLKQTNAVRPSVRKRQESQSLLRTTEDEEIAVLRAEVKVLTDKIEKLAETRGREGLMTAYA